MSEQKHYSVKVRHAERYSVTIGHNVKGIPLKSDIMYRYSAECGHDIKPRGQSENRTSRGVMFLVFFSTRFATFPCVSRLFLAAVFSVPLNRGCRNQNPQTFCPYTAVYLFRTNCSLCRYPPTPQTSLRRPAFGRLRYICTPSAAVRIFTSRRLQRFVYPQRSRKHFSPPRYGF